jgi:gamma-glutamyltranspeptidase/glutathione hydrolase
MTFARTTENLSRRARARFSLDPKSPNLIEPHKRPFNTLSAGFVMKDADPLISILLMGGDMQAQGHAQALVNILDVGADLQAATDMARCHHSQVPNRLALELSLVGKDLAGMGHHVNPVSGRAVGGFQSILVEPAAAGATGQPRTASTGQAATIARTGRRPVGRAKS